MSSGLPPCILNQAYHLDEKAALGATSTCPGPQWLNVRGYGYQVLSQGNNCNTVTSQGNCFNRLPRLSDPYSSPASFAWKEK
jgi:hypothetical protein